MDIVTAQKMLTEKQEQIAAARKEFEAKLHQLRAEETQLSDAYQRVLLGVDLDLVTRAERTIRVSGLGTPLAGDDEACIGDAIYWLSHDKPRGYRQSLRKHYYGTKNYDGWLHERSDHDYGYGPRHGSIVFSIGLFDPKAELSNEDRAAAIYFLEMLRAGKLVKSKLAA